VARVSGQAGEERVEVKPEVVQFMRIVMRRLRVHSPRELARALGMVSPDEERQVYRWVKGSSAPSFHNTLFLLDAGGLLNAEVAGWYGDVRNDKGDTP
jgi:hypothetical protein